MSVGLTAALVKRGLAVQPFKKGPDYIDPLWLSRAAGRPCYNLDFFTQTHKEITTTFTAKLGDADIGLIEGNKGLFDGVDVEGKDSNAALATMLAAPVVLVIDTGGMTRGIAPLIRGYLDFDPEVHIGGVILNKVGGARHEAKLRAALERYTNAEVLGAIGRDAALEIPERHLGLIPANEASGPAAADTMISRLADSISAGVDLDRIIEIAKATSAPAGMEGALSRSQTTGSKPDVRIAIARDAAFGFYYPDDLDAFERAGAELIPFDTLNDAHLPEADGLFIGGGFPETHLEALSANQSLLTDIRNALAGRECPRTPNAVALCISRAASSGAVSSAIWSGPYPPMYRSVNVRKAEVTWWLRIQVNTRGRTPKPATKMTSLYTNFITLAWRTWTGTRSLRTRYSAAPVSTEIMTAWSSTTCWQVLHTTAIQWPTRGLNVS